VLAKFQPPMTAFYYHQLQHNGVTPMHYRRAKETRLLNFIIKHEKSIAVVVTVLVIWAIEVM
jgi:hypothetical protein